MALRNHPAISAKRREQLRRLAEEMGFQPDSHPAALAAHSATCLELASSAFKPGRTRH
jgi:hypothetical protein